MQEPLKVTKTMKVDELIQTMQKTQKHLAIVIDEFGGTSGLVTMEDALEEMVGEIYLLKNIHRVKIEKNILKIYYNLINDGYKKYVYFFDNLIYKFYV